MFPSNSYPSLLSIRFYYTSCNVSLTSGYNVFLKTKFKKTANVIFHHVRQNLISLKDVGGNKYATNLVQPLTNCSFRVAFELHDNSHIA